MALAGAWQWALVPSDIQNRAIDWMRIFHAEKYFEGCGGFSLSEEVKWTIASQAALMALGYPDWHFEHFKTILIYPEAYVAPGPVRDIGSGVALIGEQPRLGEAWYRGPVILNWSDILDARSGPNQGHQLAVHELAHQMDMGNSISADGIPPLPAGIDSRQWERNYERELQAARDFSSQGYNILIDSYGLSSLAEFFAVTSELFFQMPNELAQFHPKVFELLLQFYRVDWRIWVKP